MSSGRMIWVEFVGQGHRSKVKVTMSKNGLWDAPLTYGGLVYGLAKEESREIGRNMTWGVFKTHIGVFLVNFLNTVCSINGDMMA